MKKAIFVLIMFLLCTSSLWADVIILQNGGRFEGEVTEKDGKIIVKMSSGIKMTFGKSEVRKIEKKQSIYEIFTSKKEKLNFSDHQKCIDLIEWCINQGLQKEKIEIVEESLKHHPNSKVLNYHINRVKLDGSWVELESALKHFEKKLNVQFLPEYYVFLRDIEKYLDDKNAEAHCPKEYLDRYSEIPKADPDAANDDDSERHWRRIDNKLRLDIIKTYILAYASQDFEKRKMARAKVVEFETNDRKDVVTCGECHGHGETVDTNLCTVCNGKKKYLKVCEKCEGNKVYDCNICEGTGQATCHNCKGEGTVKCTMGLGFSKGGCNGSGKCGFCGGTKWQTLQDAGGFQRRFKCLHCKQTGVCQQCMGGGVLGCMVCKKQKTIKCKKCGGDGELKCHSCRNKGKWEEKCDECNEDGQKINRQACPRCNGKRRWRS